MEPRLQPGKATPAEAGAPSNRDGAASTRHFVLRAENATRPLASDHIEVSEKGLESRQPTPLSPRSSRTENENSYRYAPASNFASDRLFRSRGARAATADRWRLAYAGCDRRRRGRQSERSELQWGHGGARRRR